MMRLELPMVRREAYALLRTRKAYWSALIVTAVSCLFPILAWPRAGSEAGYRTGMENAFTFELFFCAQLTAALFIIPAFTAGAIAGEREGDTIDALYSTLISPTSIVLSKVVVAAGYLIFLLCCAAPAVFVLYFLGGVTLDAIGHCYAVTFAAMVLASIGCIYLSLVSPRTAQAAVRGYFWVIFWNLLLPFVGGLGFGLLASATGPPNMSGWLGLAFYFVLTSTNPYTPITFEVIGEFRNGFSSSPFGTWWDPWVVYLWTAGVLSLLILALIVVRARKLHIADSRSRERRLAAKSEGGGSKRARRVRRSLSARWLSRLGERGGPILGNPVFLKEIRSEFFGRPWYRRAAFWGSSAIFTLVTVADMNLQVKVNLVSFIALTLLCLLTPAASAPSLPREIEQGNLDFLRGTRLTAAEIVGGKLLASLYACSGILVTAAIFLTVLVALGPVFPGASTRYRGEAPLPTLAVGAMAILSITYVFTAALSTWAGARAKRTLGALLVSYGLLCGLWLVGPITLGILWHYFSRWIVTAVHPFAALAVLLNTNSEEVEYYVCAGICMGLYAAASLGLAAAATAAYRNLHERDK